MTDYTKDQERNALAAVAGATIWEYSPWVVVRAMAKRTAEAEEKLEASRVVGEHWHSVALESQRERNALKARVAELEAKTAPPTVAPTREVWEALAEFAQAWAIWEVKLRSGNGKGPMNDAARLVVAIRKMLEVKP